MDLILVRHAIAYDRDPLRWPDDRERPLTDRGVERFEAAVSGLRRVVDAVDTVLTSPYVRAVQTATVLEEVAGWPAATTCSVLEPSHLPGEVISFLQQHHNGGAVALVGHEPLLGELAGALLAGIDGPAQPMKKGAAGCFRSDLGVAPGGMTLVWWLPPKVMRTLGQA